MISGYFASGSDQMSSIGESFFLLVNLVTFSQPLSAVDENEELFLPPHPQTFFLETIDAVHTSVIQTRTVEFTPSLKTRPARSKGEHVLKWMK